jgi:glycosyltransferase involved in cell wall biosynthesis
VTVITAPHDFFNYYFDGSSDESLEQTIDPRVRIVRAPMNEYLWEKDVRRFSALRANFPVVVDRLSRTIQHRVFPERYIGWLPGVLRKAVAMHARQRFDLVVATGNPFVSFAAAWALGRLLRIPYVVDYRDSWTFNVFTEELVGPEDGVVMRWEARVLRHAAEIVFVNDVLLRWHADRYPFAADRMAVVRNGWDPEILGEVEYQPARPDRPLRFGYLGTVTPSLPLDVIFDAWRIARNHPLLADAEFNIHGHLGFFPDGVEPLRQRLTEEERYRVHYRGYFGKTEAAKAYEQTDVLVFCAGGTRFVTSGKVFEYMATGKPIASIHAPGIAAEEVLTGYPVWFSGPRLDADTAAQSLIAAAKAARDLDTATHELAQEHAANFSRDSALRPWEAKLRSLVERSR